MIQTRSICCVVLALAGISSAQGSTSSIRARILDDGLRPVAGAIVRIVVPDSAPGEQPAGDAAVIGPPVVSADDGSFTIEPIPDMPIGARLRVVARGHANFEFPTAPRVADDLVLTRGVSILGAVRDPAGRPLAGVTVTATDALTKVAPLGSLVPIGLGQALSMATSDARGLFKLEGALPTAVALRLHKAGHAPVVIAPYAFGEPLAVEMRPTGLVRGRVFDAEARPVAARITLQHVGQPVSQHALAGSDGTFEIGLERDAPFRLTASAIVDGVEYRVQKGPLEGPVDKLVLTFERGKAPDAVPAPTAAGAFADVEVFDAATGERATDFTAGIVWHEKAAGLALDDLWRMARDAMIASVDGIARVPGPRAGEARVGTVVVVVKGTAWARRDGVTIADDADAPPIRVGLDPAARLSGRVVDPVSGLGVAGARIGWVGFGLGYSTDSNSKRLQSALAEVRSGDDGRFELDGLVPGRVELCVVCDGRPDLPPRLVDVDAGANAEIRIDAPRAARVFGILRGLGDASSTRVVARPIAVVPGLRIPTSLPPAVPVAADGRFSLDGYGPGFYALELVTPRRPRGGDVPRIVLDTFRIRAGLDREIDIDASGDLFATLELRIRILGGGLPRERIVVVAESEVLRPTAMFQAFGACAVAGSEVRAQLRIARGSYRIRVFDVATGVELLRRDGHEVAVLDPAPLDLEVAVATVAVTIRAERPGDAAGLVRLGVGVDWLRRGQRGLRSSATQDDGVGIALDGVLDGVLDAGGREVLVFVPPRPVTLRLWARDGAKDEDSKADRPTVILERELSPEVGARTPVELVVPRRDGER